MPLGYPAIPAAFGRAVGQSLANGDVGLLTVLKAAIEERDLLGVSPLVENFRTDLMRLGEEDRRAIGHLAHALLQSVVDVEEALAFPNPEKDFAK